MPAFRRPSPSSELPSLLDVPPNPAVRSWGRMRLAVYLAFVAIAANAGLQTWQTQRSAEVRQADTEVIDAVSRHGLLIQRLGRLATQITSQPETAARPTAELAKVLAQSRVDGLQLEQRFSQARRASESGASAPDTGFEHWQAARERLWRRTDALMSQLGAGRLPGLPEATEAVQQEADRTSAAAQALASALRVRSRELQASAVQMARLGAGLTIALLVALALGVVAPTLRALQRQSRRLVKQARENERLALVAEHTGNAVMIIDRERRLLWVNAAFTRATGHSLHTMRGRLPRDFLFSERNDAATLARLDAALSAGRPTRAELLNRGRGGRDSWVDADIQPLRDGADELAGFIVVLTDITEQVTQRLRNAALLSAMPTAVVVHGPGGEVLDANRAARNLLGVQAGDAADRLLQRQPLHDDMQPLTADELPVQRLLRSGKGERGQLLGLDDGEGGRRWLLVNTEPLHDALGRPDGAVACWVDMTERRHLLDELRDSARRDPLTRMPNRSVVLERVQRAIEHRRRNPGYGFAVLFMDVDRFKQVNDTLGHSAGDELLRQLATRLEETLRPGDAVARVGSGLRTAARIGGDEFVIVLEGIRHVEEACQVAERLLQDLAEPYQLGSHSVHVSVSVGIVAAEQADSDAVAVLRDADTAMYEAKRAGRGRWMVFDASMHERVKAALELEGELRRALAEDELYVVYQPLVELSNRELAGVEALVRWRHPLRGDVSPGDFIGLAEECGLIDAIGDVVLNKACAQFKLWQEQWGKRAPPLLSVNLSRAQLQQPGLVPEVRAVLAANGMKPQQLQLEVTESFAAQDEQVRAVLHALKAAGVRLALDDFGTGYSSLACLHQLPVDTVKIDRSFVAHAREVEYHRVLIAATIQVARTLGMITVAEGIETEDQAEAMTALACDRGQGWLFGRPMTAAALDRWIEREATGSLA